MSLKSKCLNGLKIQFEKRKQPRTYFDTIRHGCTLHRARSSILVSFFTIIIVICLFLKWFSKKYIQTYDLVHTLDIPPSIDKYIKWHFTMRSCLVHNNCSTPPRIIVWRCPLDQNRNCSGLGDRFRGIQFSVLLAILTKSVFFMEWPLSPLKITDVVEPSLIDWTLPDSLNLQEHSWATVAHYRWPDMNWIRIPFGVGCSSSTAHCAKKFSKIPNVTDLDSSDLSTVFEKSHNIIIYTSATGQSTSNLMKNKKLSTRAPDLNPNSFGIMNLHKVLLRVLVKPSQLIFHELEKIGLSRSDLGNYLAAHVRTGADVSEYNLHRFVSLRDFELIARELLDCVERHGETAKMPLYFASDSAALKKKVVDEGKRRNFRILIGSKAAFHIARMDKISRNHSLAEVKMAFLNVFVEFFGISGGRRVVGNISGFSKMAFYCGSAKNYVQFTSSSKNSRPSCWTDLEI